MPTKQGLDPTREGAVYVCAVKDVFLQCDCRTIAWSSNAGLVGNHRSAGRYRDEGGIPHMAASFTLIEGHNSDRGIFEPCLLMPD